MALVAATFGGILAINFIQQWRNNADFRESFANSGIDFNALGQRLRKSEGLPDIEPPDYSEGVHVILPVDDASEEG